MTNPTLKSIEGMQTLARERGGQCLSDTYQNLNTHLSWRCEQGHEWLADPYRVVRGSWCPVCARLQRRTSLEAVQRLAQERGGLCFSEHFQSRREHLDWQCAKGHRWQATLASVKQGSWCPACSHVNRRDTLEALQQVAIDRGGRCLSLAYSSCENALLWECAQGHRWEAIASSVKHRRWCPVCARAARCNTLEGCQAIAKERGGECLSSRYINGGTRLAWRCAEGHTWEANPGSVKQGTWCRLCYYESMRSTIKAMRLMAQARGGKCLSQHYVDSQTKLQWMCSIGHTWMTMPHAITQGRWCPLCAFMAKCRSHKTRRKYLSARSV
ncbi:MAG: hypothetical protein V4749_08875 [Pseudomonadota bacterium]